MCVTEIILSVYNGGTRGAYASERKGVVMKSTGTKNVLKGIAATAGFVVVLFAPTGCLVTGTTAGTTGGTTGGTLGGTTGGTVGGVVGGVVGGITGTIGGILP